MAATVLKRLNTISLASLTALQVVSGIGGKHYYNFINLGPGNLYIRLDAAPTGATDPQAYEVPVANHPPVQIYVQYGQTGLWILADQAGKVSIYDQVAP